MSVFSLFLSASHTYWWWFQIKKKKKVYQDLENEIVLNLWGAEQLQLLSDFLMDRWVWPWQLRVRSFASSLSSFLWLCTCHLKNAVKSLFCLPVLDFSAPLVPSGHCSAPLRCLWRWEVSTERWQLGVWTSEGGKTNVWQIQQPPRSVSHDV